MSVLIGEGSKLSPGNWWENFVLLYMPVFLNLFQTDLEQRKSTLIAITPVIHTRRGRGGTITPTFPQTLFLHRWIPASPPMLVSVMLVALRVAGVGPGMLFLSELPLPQHERSVILIRGGGGDRTSFPMTSYM